MKKQKKSLQSSGFQSYPENFLTQNGRKFVHKLLKCLSDEQRQIRTNNREGHSAKEATDTENSHRSQAILIERKILDCQEKLKLPVVEVKRQAKVCLPGNGVKLKINGKSMYVVIDGICVCKHILPENHAIIGANSPLGKALLHKKVGEIGKYQNGDNLQNHFIVEKIDTPAEAKWVFKCPSATII
ncbi:MAG: hypothetical protein WCO07_00275 [bacterium]